MPHPDAKPAHFARKSVYTLVQFDFATARWSERSTRTDETVARAEFAAFTGRMKLYGPDRKLIAEHDERPRTATASPASSAAGSSPPSTPSTRIGEQPRAAPHPIAPTPDNAAPAADPEVNSDSSKFACPASMTRKIEMARSRRDIVGPVKASASVVIRLALIEFFERHGVV